jgi:hypothetical protein
MLVMSIIIVFVQCTVIVNVFYGHVYIVLRFSLSFLFACVYCVIGSCSRSVSMFNTHTITITSFAVISFITTVSN